MILDRVRTLAIPRAIPPSPRPSPAPPGPGRARPVGPGPVGVILDCSEAASIVSPPGRLRRWPDGRLQGAEVGILLDQVQVDSTIIVGPGVSGTVYGIRTVQWRVASRFVGARSNFYVGFDGARVLGEQVHVS